MMSLPMPLIQRHRRVCLLLHVLSLLLLVALYKHNCEQGHYEVSYCVVLVVSLRSWNVAMIISAEGGRVIHYAECLGFKSLVRLSINRREPVQESYLKCVREIVKVCQESCYCHIIVFTMLKLYFGCISHSFVMKLLKLFSCHDYSLGKDGICILFEASI